jgi:hypothetical protein
MHPSKVTRDRLNQLTDLPNIGPAMAADLVLLGIEYPRDLVGVDPYALYERLCSVTGARHDPCVLDTFISIARFMAGEAPQPWWAYTAGRKAYLAEQAC